MDTFTAVLDACVLYKAPLRDVLIEMASLGIFRARWTNEIHEEWVKSLLAKRPDLKRENLERTRTLMDASVLDCLVTGHEKIIDTLSLPDANDRHVLAAAIVAKAGTIVTFNLKHFPEDQLAPWGIEAQHPDDFLIYQFDLAVPLVCQAIKEIRARLKNPPMDVDAYLDVLARQELPQFSQRLGKFRTIL